MAPAGREEQHSVANVNLQVFSGGQGERVLVLHDHEYVNQWEPFAEGLADHFAVVAPSHPGYGSSDLPRNFDTIDDYAYLYLDFLRQLGPEPVHLVGMGVGGWMAAELAVRCTHHLRRLVLVDAVGIKVSDHLTRDIVDTFVVGPQELIALTWHDPEAGARVMKLPGLATYTEQELVAMLRGRQTTALYAWNPYMHNPYLRRRLARIDVPTLVLWGESDRVVTPEYGRAYADSIPGARFETIPAAGHYPHLEQPRAFAAAVAAFLREGASPAPSRGAER
jgi:pimeloyl-ACP methyl ester carboxylesterase